tara:strand:+ start:15236 stop:16369 length:1134 start_codon:yes stop_codon:yes gene_type:complete
MVFFDFNLTNDTKRGTLTNVGTQNVSRLNDQLGPTQRFQVNQAIESRGGLRFNYAYGMGTSPGANNVALGATQSKGPAVRWLPFYENPMIVESRRANYANTDIYLRNEPIRLYTGAEARKFKVDVHYSVYHMAMMCPTSLLLQMFTGEERWIADGEMMAIKNYVRDTVARDVGLADNSHGDYAGMNEAIKQMHERAADGSEGPYGPIPTNVDSQFNVGLVYTMFVTKGYQEIFGLLQYALNHIRSSVIGTNSMPVKGPPVVELKWGTMYNFVPCVVTDYRIQPVEEAGYDPKSLMGQRLRVSLSLEEFHAQHGNLWGDPSITGELPGWDSIMTFGGMDDPQSVPVGPFATDYQSVRDSVRFRTNPQSVPIPGGGGEV